MTKEQYKEQQRQQRIAKTHQAGLTVANIMLGKVVSNYDNSHIWKLRNSIADEIAPTIRKRQLAGANS